ncbi:MAG: type IV pilus modification PilV family protein [Planctomycetota bacterium]
MNRHIQSAIPPARRRVPRRGLSLIEVMIALTILAITMLVAYDCVVAAQHADRVSDEEIIANRFIEEKLEEIRIDQATDYTTFARKWNGLTYDDPPGVTTTYNAYSKWTLNYKDASGTLIGYYPNLGINYYYIDELRPNINEYYDPHSTDDFTRLEYLPQVQFVLGVDLPLEGTPKIRNIIPECAGQIMNGTVVEWTGATLLHIPPLPGSKAYNQGSFTGVPFFELDGDPDRVPDSYFERFSDAPGADTTTHSRSWNYTIDVDNDGVIGDVFYADAAGYKKITYTALQGQNQYDDSLVGLPVDAATILTVPVAARAQWRESTSDHSSKYTNVYHRVEVHTVMAYTP